MVNGVGYFAFDKYIKKQKEMEATGIRRPESRVKARVREYLMKHEEAIKLKLGTTTVLSSVGALINSGRSVWALTHQPAPVIDNSVITPTPEYEEVEVFKGIDPTQKIFTNPEGTIANGRPDMRWFDKPLEFFDGTGNQIIPGKTPVSDINGPLKIVEIQDDGSRVVMGVVKDFAKETIKVAKDAAAAMKL